MKKTAINFAQLVPLIAERLKDGQSVELTVTGRSMWPLLRDRKSAVRLSAPQNLRCGEVVLFEAAPNRYYLHRLRRINRDGSFDCRGDGNVLCEKGIAPEKVLAVVTDFRRDKKWFSRRNLLYRCYVQFWMLLGDLRFQRFRHLRQREEGTSQV